MSTVQKTFRNFTRVQAQWKDLNQPLTAVNGQNFNLAGDGVDHVAIWATNAASKATGQTDLELRISLKQSALASVDVATITLTQGLQSASAIAADINTKVQALFPNYDGAGGHPPAPAKVDPSSNQLVLVNPWYVKVVLEPTLGTASAKRANFEAIGLPDNLERIVTNPFTTSKQTDVGLSLALSNHCISEPIAVPDGANVVTLWPGGTTLDASPSQKLTMPGLTLLWSNGVEGDMPAGYKSFLFAGANMGVEQRAFANNLIQSQTALNVILLQNPTPGVATRLGAVTVTVPAGATSLRVSYAAAWASLSDTPMTPPLLECAVTFASR